MSSSPKCLPLISDELQMLSLNIKKKKKRKKSLPFLNYAMMLKNLPLIIIINLNPIST